MILSPMQSGLQAVAAVTVLSAPRLTPAVSMSRSIASIPDTHGILVLGTLLVLASMTLNAALSRLL